MDEGEDSSCDADVHKELAKMAAVIGVGCIEEVCVTVNVANKVGVEEDRNNCDGDEEEDLDGGDDDDCDDEAKDEGKEDDHNGEEDLDEDENINDEDEDEKVDKGEGNDDRDEGNKGVDDDDHIECADRSFVTWEVNNLDKLFDVEV